MGRKSRRVGLWRAGNTICPVCLHEFSFERDIVGPSHGHSATIEHVPPKALPNKHYITVLTCRSCNERAGHTVDHAIIDTVKGEHSGAIVIDGKRTPIRLRAAPHDTETTPHTRSQTQVATGSGSTTGGSPVSMTLSHPATPLEVHIWSQSHPLPSIGGKRFQLEWTERQHPEVGLLKSAYLALYSMLGTRYATDPAIRPVREQIRDPSSSRLENYAFNVPVRERRICIAYVLPRSCWAIFLDGYLVLLPGSGDTDWEQRCFSADYLQQIDYRRLPDIFNSQHRGLEIAEIPLTEEHTRRGVCQVGPVGWKIVQRGGDKGRTLVSVGGNENSVLAIAVS